MKDEVLIKIVNEHCPAMGSKIMKCLQSHSSDIPYKDCADFFNEFIDDEDMFVDKTKMPANWKSNRAYANCFEALYKCVSIDEVHNYLESAIGSEKTEYLLNRFDELKKKYNNQAKKNNNDVSDDVCSNTNQLTDAFTPLTVLRGLAEVETDPVKKYLLDIIVSRFDF
jgi:hypothetical protein